MIWLERFSPYFTDSSLGLSNVRPRSCYGYIYPDTLDHSKIAYYFDYDAGDVASQSARDALYSAVGEWRAKWREEKPPTLLYRRLPARMEIVDRRTEEEQRTVLGGWQAEAYEACGDTAHSAKRLHQDLLDAGTDPELDEVHAFLDECCVSGLMVSEDDKYLALALPDDAHF